MLKRLIEYSYHSLMNITSSAPVVYIIEPGEWSVAWDGRYITSRIGPLVRARVSTSLFGLKNKIVHFGSPDTAIREDGVRHIHPSNRVILTWFHVDPNDRKLAHIPALNNAVHTVHTSCEITKQELIRRGLREDKIRVIPLGVDLEHFKPLSKVEQSNLRVKLGLPTNKLLIGSFQKDGIGWMKGERPKMVKGPDIFCDAIDILRKKFDIHVVLTGPARRYVKNRLVEMGVPYTHHRLKEYQDIVSYYQALDLYLITSRAEGGPKAILESAAAGVPLVTTPVGMAPDIFSSHSKSIVSEISSHAVAERAAELFADSAACASLAAENLKLVQNFSWERIAERYYHELYEPLLKVND